MTKGPGLFSLGNTVQINEELRELGYEISDYSFRTEVYDPAEGTRLYNVLPVPVLGSVNESTAYSAIMERILSENHRTFAITFAGDMSLSVPSTGIFSGLKNVTAKLLTSKAVPIHRYYAEVIHSGKWNSENFFESILDAGVQERNQPIFFMARCPYELDGHLSHAVSFSGEALSNFFLTYSATERMEIRRLIAAYSTYFTIHNLHMDMVKELLTGFVVDIDEDIQQSLQQDVKTSLLNSCAVDEIDSREGEDIAISVMVEHLQQRYGEWPF